MVLILCGIEDDIGPETFAYLRQLRLLFLAAVDADCVSEVDPFRLVSAQALGRKATWGHSNDDVLPS